MPARPASVAPAAAPAPTATAASALRFPGSSRIVAVGDLHGDLASVKEALRLAGAIDAEGRWAGGTMTLVQTGDQLDRGDDEPQILDLLDRLQAEAEKAGGRVVVLNGNHELLNLEGDMRYVTQDGFADFSEKKAARPVPEDRIRAFSPGGALARRLAKRPIVAIVGDTVFAHAGVLPSHVAYGLDRINDEARRWMTEGGGPAPRSIASEDSPVWTRAYGGAMDDAGCQALERVLASLGAKRLVVGHTVQARGINPACGGKVYRIDVGLSDYFGKERRTEVLELKDGVPQVLHE